jgi:hypothetical protein
MLQLKTKEGVDGDLHDENMGLASPLTTAWHDIRVCSYCCLPWFNLERPALD